MLGKTLSKNLSHASKCSWTKKSISAPLLIPPQRANSFRDSAIIKNPSLSSQGRILGSSRVENVGSKLKNKRIGYAKLSHTEGQERQSPQVEEQIQHVCQRTVAGKIHCKVTDRRISLDEFVINC